MFVSLEAGPRIAAIALLGYDAPGKCEQKRSLRWLAPFHGIIVGAYG